MKSDRQKLFLFGVLFALFVNIVLFLDQYHPILILFWLVSILLYLLSFVKSGRKEFNPKYILVVVLFLLVPSVVRILNFNFNRIHTDDLITGYFSAHFRILRDNFFAPVPADRGEWVSQFPSPFFVLQRLFFSGFGASILSVKMSTIPYVFITTVFLYLLAKKFWGATIAIISVVIFAFFPMSLYLDTLGLHFLASTAVFLVFLYVELTLIRSEKPDLFRSCLSGVLVGFSFLFYSSSYIALPISVMFRLYQFLRVRKKWVIHHAWYGAFGVLIVVSPFLAYMLKHHNFYFMQRFDQVNIINGTWTARNPGGVGENTALSLKSLYTNGIGGHGGYNFGHLALFEPMSFFLFLTGIALLLPGIRKNPVNFFILTTIVTLFLAGMALTIPPPAFHRFSVAFPLVALTIAYPIGLIAGRIRQKRIALAFVTFLLILYAVLNEAYFQKSVQGENQANTLRIARFINEKYSDRKLYIASFPGFAFEKIYFFSSGKKARKIETDYHNNLLKKFKTDEKYAYVIIFSEVFNEKFQEKDPNGKIIQFPENYSVFVN